MVNLIYDEVVMEIDPKRVDADKTRL